MRRTLAVFAAALSFLVGPAARAAPAEVVTGSAMIAAVSPVIKILREPGTFESLKEGDTLYIFTETGRPVTAISVKNVFSDEIHSEPLVEELANKMRDDKTILIFANVPEYGSFIKAYLDGGEAAFRRFIDETPNSLLVREARKVIDGIIYRPYKLAGTIEAFDDFISRHPDNFYAENAVQRHDKLEYAPYKTADLIGSYRKFISLHPNNRNVPEAQARIRDILASFEEVSIDQLAKAASSLTGRRVKFYCYLRSILPIFVSGDSVGRKTAKFASPRPGSDYINIQVEGSGFVLWKLFVSREDAELTQTTQLQDRNQALRVFGQVFSNDGNAPWIDVLDMEPAN
jgi:hypothetical protein